MRLEKYLTEGFNKDNVRELVLFIENDGDLYRQMVQPIIKNLKKHQAKGRYNATEAQKSWVRLAEAGAKKYVKEFGSSGDKWNTMFSVADRKQAGLELADSFEEEVNSD
jgi:hypothetical protein